MIRVVIVEDNSSDAALITSFLEKLQTESGMQFSTIVFKTAEEFLKNYTPVFDVVLMDIEMPGINGMDAAKRLRAVNDGVTIIFVTNIASWAVKGYEVKAADFIVKPVSYVAFKEKILYAIKRRRHNTGDAISIKTVGGTVRLPVSAIRYVEVALHKILIHTDNDTIEVSGSMSAYAKMLEPYGLLRCNNCYLINPCHIRKVEGDNVIVDDENLVISRSRKKDFLTALSEYFASEEI